MTMRMYKGIDTLDNTLSYFAHETTTGEVAVTFADEGTSSWDDKDLFLAYRDMFAYTNLEDTPHLVECIRGATLLWEE